MCVLTFVLRDYYNHFVLDPVSSSSSCDTCIGLQKNASSLKSDRMCSIVCRAKGVQVLFNLGKIITFLNSSHLPDLEDVYNTC